MSEQYAQPRQTIKQVDAAERYGVSDRTLRRWEISGRITGERIGNLKLYPVRDLERLTGANKGK